MVWILIWILCIPGSYFLFRTDSRLSGVEWTPQLQGTAWGLSLFGPFSLGAGLASVLITMDERRNRNQRGRL